jgi:hypothetical protein
MARAFIASVPLAIVAVAALVVPLMVIPGTFGFQGWPTSPGGKVSEHQVQVAPAPRTVVVRKPQADTSTKHRPTTHASLPLARRQVAAIRTTSAPAGGSTPAAGGQTVHGHRSTAVLEGPSGSGPGGPSHEDPVPSTPPGTPAAPPEQPAPTPSTVPTPDTVASDEPPIARENPADNPVVTPPPAPVQEVVPQQAPPPAAPLASAPPCDQDRHGHGRGNGHDNGLHLGLGLGHGRGHDGDRH